jgi:hypothetical protein
MLSGRTWMNWQALKSSRRSLCGATTGADGARVGRAVRARMGAMMAEHGLGLWHFAVLSALDDSGPASQRELDARLRIDPGDLVEVAGRLEDAGLVRRERDPADGYLLESSSRVSRTHGPFRSAPPKKAGPENVVNGSSGFDVITFKGRMSPESVMSGASLYSALTWADPLAGRSIRDTRRPEVDANRAHPRHAGHQDRRPAMAK